MFERFTDRARKVMALANEEAQRFNDDYVVTEHVLLGLIKEGCTGVGGNALKHIGIDLERLKSEIERRISESSQVLDETSRTSIDRIREHACQFARDLNHAYVGTEHLLDGLLAEKGSTAELVLSEQGVDRVGYRVAVATILGYSLKEVRSPDNPDKSLFDVAFPYNFSIHPCAIRLYQDGFGIGEIPISDGKLGTPILKYEPGNTEQIESVTNLRDTLESRKIIYEEHPPRNEVAKSLRDSVRNVISLVDRVEGGKIK